MTYTIKEIFYTLQGEGARTGRPAVFCRFAGCNLWSGREEDRAGAMCNYCDTDFVGINGILGRKYPDASSLSRTVDELWPTTYASSKYVVLTGGEPLLQLDAPLIDALHERGFEIAIETNGSLPVPPGIDWVCVSPKAGAKLVVHRGDEIKLVLPQSGMNLADYESLDFSHFFVQPLDNADSVANVRAAIDVCLRNPRWKLSLQTHKFLNIP